MVTTNMYEAQLFWDAQDPGAAGWLLRYRDQDGIEQSAPLEGVEDRDASIEALADHVVGCAPQAATGQIRVCRGDRDTGIIHLVGGEIYSWRAV